MIQDKRFAVTGGAGFIGSHLVDALLKRGAEAVLAVDNLYLGTLKNLDHARTIAGERLEISETDLTRREDTLRLLETWKPDAVFNLAAIPLPASLADPLFATAANVTMTLNLCEAHRSGTFGSLIQFSSSEACGTAQYVPMDEGHPLMPRTPYAASKAATDHVAMAYASTFGTEVRVVRPFNNYGPRQNADQYAGAVPRFITRMLAGNEVEIYGDGSQTRDFTYVTDTASATIAIYESDTTRGRLVNVASGIEVNIVDLAHRIAEIIGCAPRIRHLPPRPGDVSRHVGDGTLLRKLTGYSPSTGLEAGLRQTVEWYASRTAVRTA